MWTGPNDWGYILFSLWSIYDFLSLINHHYDSFFNNFGWTGQVYLHVYRQKTRLLDSDSDCVMIYMTNTYKKRRRHQISLISMSTWIYICQHCENCGFTLRIFSFNIFFLTFWKYLKFAERIIVLCSIGVRDLVKYYHDVNKKNQFWNTEWI